MDDHTQRISSGPIEPGRMKPCEKCGLEYFPLRRGYCHRCDMNRRSRVGYECSYVDAAPARAHIRALVAAGVSLRGLATMAGVDRKRLHYILRGRRDRGAGPSQRITRTVADKILAVPVPESRLAVVAEGDLVDSVGTARRLQSLVAFGYSRDDLGRRMGYTGGRASCSGNISRLMDPALLTVRAGTARRAAALFCELQMVPGGSTRATTEGLRRGWPLPMDWDEESIDDPRAVTFRSGPPRLSRADIAEDIAQRQLRVVELTKLGLSASRIASELKVSVRQVVRDRAAAGRAVRGVVAESLGVSA